MSLIHTLLLAAGNESAYETYGAQNDHEIMNYVTPVAPIMPTILPVLPTPPLTTDSIDFYRHLSPVKSYPKYIKTVFPPTISSKFDYESTARPEGQGDNITVFTLDDVDTPFKTIQAEHSLVNNNNWEPQNKPDTSKADSFRKSQTSYQSQYSDKHNNIISNENNIPDYFHSPVSLTESPQQSGAEMGNQKYNYEPVRKVPISQIDNLNYFLPAADRPKPKVDNSYHKYQINAPLKPNNIPEPIHAMQPQTVQPVHSIPSMPQQMFFQPLIANQTNDYHVPRVLLPQPPSNQNIVRDKPVLRKQVTILKTKDMKTPKTSDLYNGDLWRDESKAHVLTKLPNPYETVLLRAVPNAKIHMASRYNSKLPHMAGKPYTTLDLEHLLNQMEVESVVNKNLGRSADKGEDVAEGLSPALVLASDFLMLLTDFQFLTDYVAFCIYFVVVSLWFVLVETAVVICLTMFLL